MKRFLFLLVFLTITSTTFAQNIEQAKKLIEEGIKLHDAGEYDNAIEKYNEALNADKDNLFALAEKGLTLHYLKKYKESIECCKLAIEKHSDDPNLITVYVTYGNSLDLINKTDQSIELYDQGIKKFPDYYQLHFNKGVSLNSVARYEEAIQAFKASLKLQPRHPGSHNGLAVALDLSKQRIPAVLAYCAYLAIDPMGRFAKNNITNANNIFNSFISSEGPNKINIKLFSSSKVNKEDEDDNFMSAELFFSISQINLKDSKDSNIVIEKTDSLNKSQLFKKNLENLCKSTAEKGKNKGFIWDYYVPYFQEMSKKDFIETFAYLANYSQKEPYTLEWLQKNQDKVKDFIEWNSKYQWIK